MSMPNFFEILLLKYDNKKSVAAVVDSKNSDDEKTIFLSNSVNVSCEYGLKRNIRNRITKYFNADCISGKYAVTDLKYAKFKTTKKYMM